MQRTIDRCRDRDGSSCLSIHMTKCIRNVFQPIQCATKVSQVESRWQNRSLTRSCLRTLDAIRYSGHCAKLNNWVCLNINPYRLKVFALTAFDRCMTLQIEVISLRGRHTPITVISHKTGYKVPISVPLALEDHSQNEIAWKRTIE